LILEPTIHSNDAFPERRSFGLNLVAGGADLHTYTVAGLRAGSPAEAAGFHQGDGIARADDRPAAQVRLSPLRDPIGPDGRHPIFKGRRGDQTLNIAVDITTVSIER